MQKWRTPLIVVFVVLLISLASNIFCVSLRQKVALYNISAEWHPKADSISNDVDEHFGVKFSISAAVPYSTKSNLNYDFIVMFTFLVNSTSFSFEVVNQTD